MNSFLKPILVWRFISSFMIKRNVDGTFKLELHKNQIWRQSFNKYCKIFYINLKE